MCQWTICLHLCYLSFSQLFCKQLEFWAKLQNSNFYPAMVMTQLYTIIAQLFVRIPNFPVPFIWCMLLYTVQICKHNILPVILRVCDNGLVSLWRIFFRYYPLTSSSCQILGQVACRRLTLSSHLFTGCLIGPCPLR